MNRLQVGIDFSQKKADFCLLFSDGQPLEPHVSFANSCSGYSSAKQLLLDALDTYTFDGVDVSGEATGYLWLPFFLQLASDPDLALRDMDLFLLNPRWVKWFKKCFAEDHKCDEKDAFYIAERTRTRRPGIAWSPPDCLPLRFYTRLRFHVVQNLAREKSYFSAFLFLTLAMTGSLLKAVRSRGGGLIHSIRVQGKLFAEVAGLIFIRSFERAERVNKAMVARGYHGAGSYSARTAIPSPGFAGYTILALSTLAIVFTEWVIPYAVGVLP